MDRAPDALEPIGPGDRIGFATGGVDGVAESTAFTVAQGLRRPLDPAAEERWTRAAAEAERRSLARAAKCRHCGGKRKVTRQKMDSKTRQIARGPATPEHPRGEPLCEEVDCVCVKGQGDPARRPPAQARWCKRRT